jgi:NAD(P)-dependent dehydrogenase (short-subunit alcohol dehydrogenase family)
MNTLDRLFGLDGKVVLVTGASGQLGEAVCRAFLEVGARVYGTDKVPPTGARRLDHERMHYLALDITSKVEVDRVLSEVVAREGRLDVLINNAGVSCFEPFEQRPEESFDWVMDVNLKGTFFCIQTYARLAREKGIGGAIVNIGSMYGVISPDFRIYADGDRRNSEVYGATKAGVIQMTRYFGAHLAAAGIRVNCVSPGGLWNPENPQGADFVKQYSFRCPMGRMAETREILGAILYLASDAASYTTGHNLLVDGGMSCW